MTPPDATQNLHGASFYDRIAAVYDLIADRSEHAARVAGETALDVQAGGRVLEIGFGTGHSLVAFGHRVLPGGSVDGVDTSEGMLAVAAGRIDRAGLAQIVTPRLADARALPFEGGSFDAVFMSFTLELFDDDDATRVLAEVRRVLRTGSGRLGVVAMASMAGHESIAERGYVWMHRHFPHVVDCRPIEVRPTLKSAGFRVSVEQRLMMWGMPVDVVVGANVQPPSGHLAGNDPPGA